MTPKSDLSSYSTSNLIPLTKRPGDNHAAPIVAVRQARAQPPSDTLVGNRGEGATVGARPLELGWPAAMVTNQWSPIDDPEYWRKRAKVVRALVEKMHEPEAKEMMLRIAQEYEDLAKAAEQQRHIPAQGDSTNKSDDTQFR